VVAAGLALPFGIVWAEGIGTGLVGRLGGWARPLAEALGWANPLYIFARRGGDPEATARALTLAMVVQAALGLGLVPGPAAVLRPLGRGAGAFGWQSALWSWLLSRHHWLPRRGCGDHPMIWKECSLARTTGLFRMATLIAVLGIAIPLVDLTARLALPAL